MNFNQTNSLLSSVYKFIENKYSNIKIDNYDNIKDNNLYLKLFDEATLDVFDITKAMFILPNGKMKRFELDLSDFNINEVFKINFNINNENIYSYLNIKHEYIKYLGFDLIRLLQNGCFRVGNNKINKEIYLQTYLTKKVNKKVIDILETCLLYYDNIIIDYIGHEDAIDTFLRYSKKNGDTIKDIKKDLNEIVLSKK